MSSSTVMKKDPSSQAEGLALPKYTLIKHVLCTLVNGKSKIDPEHLKSTMKGLGYNHTRSEVETMLEGIKPYHEGAIEFEDFLPVLDSKVQDEASDAEIFQVFKVFDRGKTGFITSGDIYSVMQILGLRLNKEQLNAIFKEADLNCDRVINFDDFYRLVKHK